MESEFLTTSLRPDLTVELELMNIITDHKMPLAAFKTIYDYDSDVSMDQENDRFSKTEGFEANMRADMEKLFASIATLRKDNEALRKDIEEIKGDARKNIPSHEFSFLTNKHCVKTEFRYSQLFPTMWMLSLQLDITSVNT